MTEGEKSAYKKGFNNGFIIGMVSKGVVGVDYISPIPPSIDDVWFDLGVVNDTPLGNIEFHKQKRGINNKDTYLNDGYILLSYTSKAGTYLSYIISQLYLPRAVYKSVIVDYTLESYPIGLYQPHIGLMSYKEYETETHRFSYKTTLEPTQEVKQYRLDLTEYNNSAQEMYLHIGGGSTNLKIYKIQLELI